MSVGKKVKKLEERVKDCGYKVSFDGVIKSYNEILKLLDLIGEQYNVLNGSGAFLSDENPPIILYFAKDLSENAINAAESYAKGTAWTRCIWDVTAVAWLLNDNDKFMDSTIIPTPIPTYDNLYSENIKGLPMRYVYDIKRDALMTDLINKITL